MPIRWKRPGISLACALLLAGSVHAGESRIELTDGSVITGELVGVGAGQYRVQSPALGELSIPESRIRAVQPLSGSTPAAAADHSADIAAIQKQLMTDPELMSQVTALQQDPEVQQILSDPELSRMALSGDIEGLTADPRFQRLMRSPAIQAIMGQVLGR